MAPSFETVLSILKNAITDIKTTQGMTDADKKAYAITTISKLIANSSLPQEDKDIMTVFLTELVNFILPFLINNIVNDVKGCFSFFHRR